MQDVLNHQASRMFDDVTRERMSVLHNQNPNIEFELLHKFGSDGSTHYETYEWQKRNDAIDTSSLYASYLTPVQLIAKTEFDREILFTNPMVNSPYGICPLRQSLLHN